MSRAEARKRQNALRDISQALVQLKFPGNAATQYSEALVAIGVRDPDELPSLSKLQLDACKIRSNHRQLLKTAAALATAQAASPSALSATSPDDAVRPGCPTGDVEHVSNEEDETDADSPEEAEESVIVGTELDGMRLDAALASLLPPLSRSYFSSLCSEGYVRIDGKICTKKSIKVTAGATISVVLRAAAELAVKPQDLNLDVIYEDEVMLAVNKASGMVTHPAPGHWDGTFANALASRVLGQAASLPDLFGDGLRPGIVHRLDRFTTGVRICHAAKHSDTKCSHLL